MPDVPSHREKWEESEPRTRHRWLLIALTLLFVQLLIAVLAVRGGLMLFGIGFGLCAIMGFSLFLCFGPYARRRD